jgi:CheY-like chemotaxis protein
MKNVVLVVEDELMTSKFLENLLKKDYEVVTKNNGLDAILWIKDGNIPFFIIADLYMPQLDGFEFIALLKSNHLYSKIPLVILSSDEKETTKNECLKAGANKYFTKPVNLEDLAALTLEPSQVLKKLTEANSGI